MRWTKTLARGAAALTLAAAIAAPQAARADTITLAEADTLTGENLIQLVALARAAERGVDAEIISLKSDDVVFQAVLNGQIDIGVGTAYAAQQTLGDSPVRNFYQLRRLAYFPVVNKEKITSWQDLDGAPITVHARGSGTEAIARFMEGVHGIKFSEMSFVPGSEVRAVALRRGNIDATFLDITNTRLVTNEAPDKFGLLPMGDTTGSDSVLYATTSFLEENADAVQVIVEELMRAAKEFNADPTLPAKLREEMDLLPDLPEELVGEITPYFETATTAGLFPEDGGGLKAAEADVAFLTQSGALTGDPADIDPASFWTFDIIEKAKAATE
ncbi:MAG: ABC transporter substrate-binding protein [Pseudomonadota bacterium]